MATLTLTDHAFTFLTVFREQHRIHHPTQALPRVTLSQHTQQQQAQSSRYSVCQVLLWESMLTYALDPLAIATHFLESLFPSLTVRVLEVHTVSALPVAHFFEDHVLTDRLRAAFTTVSRDVLHNFLLPLKNKGQTPLASRESPTKRTRTLKDLVRHRDGHICPATGAYDRLTPPATLPDAVLVTVDLELAHIVPFSIADKAPSIHAFISLFSGGAVPAGTVAAAAVNHPRNALLLQADAHRDFDAYRWGVDAAAGVYRVIKIHTGRRALSFVVPTAPMLFNAGAGGSEVDAPSEALFRLHLAVGRVLHMSGAGERFEEMRREEEEMRCAGLWMDGSEMAAATLERALARLGWGKAAGSGLTGVRFAEVEL